MNISDLNPIKGFAEGIGNLIDKFVQTPDEKAEFHKKLLELSDKAEERSQQALQGARDAYIAELKHSDHSSKFNKIVDGVSRLVRPIVTYGVILAIFGFIDVPTDLDPNLWTLATIVFAFWFGGRLLKRDGGIDAIKSFSKK